MHGDFEGQKILARGSDPSSPDVLPDVCGVSTDCGRTAVAGELADGVERVCSGGDPVAGDQYRHRLAGSG